MEHPIACTIVAKNYLAQARVFARSFKKFHPDGTVYVLFVDRIEGSFEPSKEPFITVLVEEIGIPDLPSIAFRYHILEFSTAVKPFFLEYLLERRGHDHVMFFDPDILWYAPASPIIEALQKNAIVLIPHLTDPLPEDGHLPSQTNILRSGTYNLGFIAIRKTSVVQDFLRWWKERLRFFCYVRLDQGFFLDQRWIDLVPGLFPDICILTDRGCNVAYWNLFQRTFNRKNGTMFVNGQPLRFFHFSGFDPQTPEILSKHQTRFCLKHLPMIRELCLDYAKRLSEEGVEQVRSLPYTCGFFADGTPIPPIARTIFEDQRLAKKFPNPFATGPDSFFAFLCSSVKNVGNGAHLTRFHLALRDHDPVLRALFPSLEGTNAIAYAMYLLMSKKLPKKLRETLEPLKYPKIVTWKKTFSHALQRRHQSQLYQKYCRLGRTILGQKTFIKLREGARSLVRTRATYVVPIPPVPTLGLNIAGYLCAESGLGEAVRGNVHALDSTRIPVALKNIDRTYARQSERALLERDSPWNPYKFNLVHVNADEFPACIEDLGEAYFWKRYTIGYWEWEIAPFPKEWIPRFGAVQEIWTASTYTQRILQEHAPVSIHVIPHVVHVATERRKSRHDFALPPDRFLFLFIFDFHSVFERKNPLGIVRAFERAFPHGSNATLVIKTMHGNAYPEERTALQEALRRINGIHIESIFSRNETHDLIACSDAYISLHRSEGFGLTIAEAMCLGKPVIVSTYGGNTDFTNATNSFSVAAPPITIENDYGPYKAGGVWGDPDIEQAAHLMRCVVNNASMSAIIAKRGQQTIQTILSPENVGERIRDRLQYLAQFYLPSMPSIPSAVPRIRSL